MLKKALTTFILCGISILPSYCEISQKDMETAYSYYEQAEKLSKNNQYSGAIDSLKKGLRLNPYDSNIRIGLINNYLLRATYFNNKSHEYIKAMNDLRSALFFLKYYGAALTDASAVKAITENTGNLNYLYKQTQIATNLKNRYQIAKNLRREGNFSASAYEFIQASADATIAEDCYIQTGELSAMLGNNQNAADYFKKALKINPNKAATHLKLAKAYEALNETTLANNEYNYTLTKTNNDNALLLELESIWIKKIGLNPNDAEAHTNLGAVYQKLNDNQKALQEYTKAMSLNPQNPITRFNLGTLYQGQKDYNKAISAYDEVLQLEPQNKSARFYKAQCLNELKQFDKAVEQYRKLLADNPDDKEVKSLMLEAMKQITTPEEMLDHFEQATSEGATSPDTLYTYAYELHKANRLDDAIANYQKVIALDANNADAYINLAQAYKQKNDYINASAAISKGLAKLPNNADLKKYSEELNKDIASIHNSAAYDMYKSGRYEEAIAKYTAIEPKTTETYINIGACYQALNNDKKAIEYYKLALAKEPQNGDIAYYLGQAYSNIEDWSNAQSYLAKARTLKPDDNNIKELYNYVIDQQDQIALSRALDLYSKGEYASALAVLNNILSQNKNNAFAYYYRGLVYDAQKKYSLAQVEYQKTIQLSDAIPEAYYSLALDYDYLGKRKEAYLQYQKYLTLAAEENEFTKYTRERLKELTQYAN